MLTASTAAAKRELTANSKQNWQRQLASSFTNPKDLLKFLGLRIPDTSEFTAAADTFPFRVTKSFASRMKKGDPNDPLLRQVLPAAAETDSPEDFTGNPVGDLESITAPGLLHKYEGRVLLVVTGACAINCRYCFRREFPYQKELFRPAHQAQGLHYISTTRSIKEVILSGGDPLVLNDSRLKSLIESIAAIPHVSRLRIHTRLPVVLPARITTALTQLLTTTRLTPIIVVHINHPNEIDADVVRAMRMLANAKIPLFNQSVLLKDINDDPQVLIKLSEVLFSIGINPYYLHLLDKTKGASHFDTPLAKARAIQKQLQMSLPGYLVPKMVRERPGKPYKIPL